MYLSVHGTLFNSVDYNRSFTAGLRVGYFINDISSVYTCPLQAILMTLNINELLIIIDFLNPDISSIYDTLLELIKALPPKLIHQLLEVHPTINYKKLPSLPNWLCDADLKLLNTKDRYKSCSKFNIDYDMYINTLIRYS
jgi:hypothetical protein